MKPFLFILCFSAASAAQDLPPNRWVELAKDAEGARRGSAVRYASRDGKFFLWGFMNADPDLLQEQPLMRVPEYDMVAFDPAERRWSNHMPERTTRLPLAYIPRTYSGITTGSERTVMRGLTEDSGGAPRPDLNIVFDQVTYRPLSNSLYYFTGGLTASYDIARRRWRDLQPRHAPPPVLGGSLAWDPGQDEIVLFGGGHVAERDASGPVRGYTGTWVYRIRDNDWEQLPLSVQPPPRMNTRMVCDTRNQVLVLFGGDSQTHYLGDTWLFDLKTHTWRASKAPGPDPRAGHFTVYDPESGLVLLGGGYNRKDLADMWAYDAARDRWQRIEGQTPAGFYLSADIAPEKRLIVLLTDTQKPGDRLRCNMLYPVRTTYGYQIGEIRGTDASSTVGEIPKREPENSPPGRSHNLAELPAGQWIHMTDPGRIAPTRTWGSATFDTRRERILYWGGGHCGYGGSDVDQFDVRQNTWTSEPAPSYPERLWNHGVRLAGVTFDGEPWTDHGRRVYAYDPVSDKLIMARSIRLTSGYEPAWLKPYPSKTHVAPDAVVSAASSYVKYVTWSYDLEKRAWTVAGPAPAGVDTLVTTPLGVMGVNVNWPGRLNDAGYQLPWSPSQPPEDNAIYLWRGARWERLSQGQPSPQNLYELTSLTYDTQRGQVILHGGGKRRDELWTFDVNTRRWKNMEPRVLAPAGANPPVCAREAVYLPKQDVMLIYGAEMWAYTPADNAWRRTSVGGEVPKTGQNRAMVYDPKLDVVLLVLGAGGDEGRASVYALRYRPVGQ